MDLQRLSPYIRRATDSYVPADWQLAERMIFDYELLYIKQGELMITVEGKPYRGKPGDLFLIKPRQRHAIRSVGQTPVRQPHIHFDLFYRADSPEVKVSFKPIEAMTPGERAWFREDVVSGPPFAMPTQIPLRNPLPFETMLFHLIKEFQAKTPYSDIAAKGLFIQLWVYLLRELRSAHHPETLSNQRELALVKSYLDQHSGGEVSLQTLSRLANLSKYYLVGLFKKAYGVTPIKYHQLVRMEKAKEMIQFTSVPLKQIAESFGYRDIHSFSRTFRKVEGVPPSYYRPRGKKAEERLRNSGSPAGMKCDG